VAAPGATAARVCFFHVVRSAIGGALELGAEWRWPAAFFEPVTLAAHDAAVE